MVYETHTAAQRGNQRYRDLTNSAHELSSLLQDIEEDYRRGIIRNAEGVIRTIEQRIDRLWRQAREALAAEERLRREEFDVDLLSSDGAQGRASDWANSVPGWNGAGSDVDGRDMEADRG